ncbi:N-acyl homoserine lactonase family protein [Achromobacter insolitus]|uniref:N-acyl homoserine lactonase family protein n=1 Tax=Achromobacter insolitus TaxID=217204 RepID=UPI0007C6AD24|nr:N-acyl homoserine lactonase family protein [Achromobacter insolitus]MCP1403364.1 glyoxylase-like metal-dependent hydrolase (beta-lactamase superfamily II) [Achromobacter insolitus]OAE50137.1 MBL fold hydrolase [Achromobacter insolitus]OCZ51212.1 MBL fold hydrolase [Achromobacter insolitus]
MSASPLLTAALPAYEVYAIRYATVARRAVDNFLSRNDAHDGPMPLDFYCWVVRGGGRTVLVDTGFSACSARARGRAFCLQPGAALARLGLAPEDIGDLILTHLHYDHAGNVEAYPNARVHLQDAEMRYATGRYMCFEAMRHFFSADDLQAVVRRLYAGRVQFHDGDARLAPGLELYRIGGHTPGLQVVRVHTGRGWIVLASDALHYYRNYTDHNPFPAIFHVGDMLEGYARIRSLADSDAHIVPGHDPLVAKLYPRMDEEDGIYRLDMPPS